MNDENMLGRNGIGGVFFHGKCLTAMHITDSSWHDFPFWRVVKIEEGAGVYICPGTKAKAVKGDFFLLKPGRRRIAISNPLRQSYIPFSMRKFLTAETRGSRPVLRHDGAPHERRALANAFMDIREELVRKTCSTRAGLQMRVILSIFFNGEEVISGKHEFARPPGVHEAALLMATHPEQRVSVPEMAEMSGYSASHFSRLFLQAYGVSPARYAVKMRIDAARRLLKEDGLSVKETAYSLNYSSAFAFSRQFKEEVRSPPSEYTGVKRRQDKGCS